MQQGNTWRRDIAEMLGEAAHRSHFEADLLFVGAGFLIGVIIGAGIGSFGMLGAIMALRFGGF